MTLQSVGIATAIVSAAVAALGLLLSWHRERDPARPWLVGGCAIAVVGVGTIGVALVFTLDDPQVHDGPAGREPPRLTAAEYRQEAGVICAHRNAVIDRVFKLESRRSEGSVAVQFERTALNEFRGLKFPIVFEKRTRDVVALWTRRVTLIEDVFRQLENFANKKALIGQLAEVDRLTRQLNRRFKMLGLRECLI